MTSKAPPQEAQVNVAPTATRITRDAGGNAFLEGSDSAISGAGFGGVLALAIAAAPTGITVADPALPDCPLVFMNPAFTAMTGYSPEDVLGRNCRFLQGRGTEKESVRALRLAIAAGKAITLEFINHRKDGKRFVNELRMAPVRDQTGQLIAYIGIQNDVTARKRAEREATRARRSAERANQEKSDFLAFMSHEVRTPLHGVMGTLSLLLDTGLDAEQRAYAETAQRCGATLLHTVNDLLDLSRIEAGKLRIHPAPFALAELIKDVLDLLAPAAAEKGIDLSASIDHLLPAQLSGDAGRIRQVLMNLADNAVKFTHRGNVEIRLAALPDGHVGFAVTDTGIGIPPRLRASLFTRFVQADSTGEQVGSGLGLGICKRLVALMGGQIAVDSAQGRGSTFFFDLPLAHIPQSGSPPSRISPHPVFVQPLGGAHGRILIAEDGKASQLVAAAILRKAGYTVELARDGTEAAAAAESSDYDLILMDLRMPLMDGYAATRAIRALPGPRGRVPIIAMTASVMPDDTEHCAEAGMDGHLAKPLSKTELLAAVGRVLDARPSRPRVAIPESEPGAIAPLLDRETLEELRSAVGPGRLPRLISVFTAETRERVRRMHGLTDPVRIEDEAHSLKAAAATFGAIALRDAARALEEACQNGEPGAWRRILDVLPGLADRSLASFPSPRTEARAKQDRDQKGR